MDFTKPDFFTSAISINRHKLWRCVKYFTPKGIYQYARDEIAKHGARNVYFGFAKPMRITSIIISL